MIPIHTKISGEIPGVAVLTVSRVFSFSENRSWDGAGYGTFSEEPGETSFVDALLMPSLIYGATADDEDERTAENLTLGQISYQDTFQVSGQLLSASWAVWQVETMVSAEGAWSLEVWSQNSTTLWGITADDRLLLECKITVEGMIKSGFCVSSPAEETLLSQEELALPSGRLLCIKHRQLNL